ncbi:MAG: O-methyltransferase [Solirubrobacteraceae bacterium]
MSGRVRARLAGLLGGSSPKGDQALWSATDRYICERLRLQDPLSDAALDASSAAGLPPITVTANQGKLLELLARLQGARRILELGTLGGYSTIWLARALPPGGHLVTLEANPAFAEVARANIAAAGLEEIVELRLGPALQTLPELPAEEPFDLIFIDADKENYPSYLEWSLKLSRPGTLIVADNVVRSGALVLPPEQDPWGEPGGAASLQRLYELLGAEPRLSTTAIQTVGDKGYDGFALALVRS